MQSLPFTPHSERSNQSTAHFCRQSRLKCLHYKSRALLVLQLMNQVCRAVSEVATRHLIVESSADVAAWVNIVPLLP